MAKGETGRTDVLQGTLDLMVLRTLDTIGPLHGHGIARRLEQVSEDALKLNEGTVDASPMRLLHRRLISTTGGTSENNRKAQYYTLTRIGSRPRTIETHNGTRNAGVRRRGACP